MDSALSLMRRSYFRPKIRLYNPPEDGVVRQFDDPWKRFDYLRNFPKKPSKFKQGDICKVINKKSKFYGKTAKVNFASGDYIEVYIGNIGIVLKEKDLKWIRHSSV